MKWWCRARAVWLDKMTCTSSKTGYDWIHQVAFHTTVELIKQTKLVMQIPFALVIVERSGFSEVTVMLYDASRTPVQTNISS